jgi:hypothetical protein
MEHTLDIDIEAFIEVRLRDLGRRLVAVTRAGVVDHDVEAAELFFRGADEGLPGRGVGHGASDGRDVVRRVGGGEVLGEAGGVEVGGDDFAAFGDEEAGCCEAEAGCSAWEMGWYVSMGARWGLVGWGGEGRGGWC